MQRKEQWVGTKRQADKAYRVERVKKLKERYLMTTTEKLAFTAFQTTKAYLPRP
ncbi:MAG: hypothetical protein ACI33P_04955 [Lysinibacillus sp.]